MSFTPIPTGFVVLVRNGVYRQCDAYHRKNELYAKGYGGFVRILNDRTTSGQSILCVETNLPAGWKFGPFGKLTYTDTDSTN